ncbi:LLM class flavin-dependent oxidoreductase [Mycolicibacterium vinylchloridicum]|uniref:LLM class flavin-dependent oxidoreductase n=1 Tax=Mycolicibacterium vinylchloridicum TaxID=2736928 RepID=UPI0015CC9A08|nr:LLM class flavin-dependent oxidoreductase [Mycolicibacterium vinylchloridicum]
MATYSAMLDELRKLVVQADELGFHSFSTVEHHFHTEGIEVMPSPMVLYSHLAAITKQISFIPLSLVLPTSNPLRIAEDVALFDQLYPGRIQVGVARGYQSRWMQTIAQQELIASGNPASDAKNREIFNEYLEVLLKAWTEDAFSYNGKYFQVPFPFTGIKNWPTVDISREFGAEGEIDDEGSVVKIGVVPAPATKPHPEIWVPFSLSPQTMINAARSGYKMLLFPSNPVAVRDFCRKFQEEAANAGFERQLGEGIAAVRDVAIADSYDEAFELAVRGAGTDFFNYFQHFGYMENWRDETDPEVKPLTFSTVEDLTKRIVDKGWLLCGTAESVTEQIAELKTCYTEGGNLEIFSWNMYAQGNLTTEETVDQLRLFGEKVMPHFTAQ